MMRWFKVCLLHTIHCIALVFVDYLLVDCMIIAWIVAEVIVGPPIFAPPPRNTLVESLDILKVLSNENYQGSWVVSIESIWFAIVPMDVLFLI
jgi:hypothetical protein